MKLLLLTLSLFACSSPEVTRHTPPQQQEPVDSDLLLTCSSSSNGSTLQCTNGQQLPLPPTFPHSKDCNECLTTIVGDTASVKCPNGLQFSFTLVKGTNGKDGSSCSVTNDGWVKCTDGTGYKLLQGPKGDKGDKGERGGSCRVTKNSQGLTVIRCDDGSEEVVSGCGGGGCWSFGSRGNVYKLPTTTTSLPNFSSLTPVSVAETQNFAVFNRQSSLGMPYTYTPAFTDTEYYGIRFEGFIELGSAPNNNVCFRLTSDDGSRFSIGQTLVEVVAMPNQQPPSAKTGCVQALAGWHSYRLDWYQGPRTQIALALEVSLDNGATYLVVQPSQLKFQRN